VSFGVRVDADDEADIVCEHGPTFCTGGLVVPVVTRRAAARLGGVTPPKRRTGF
jgi:hypothetical protein